MKRKVKKALKKANEKIVLCLTIFIVLGAAIGYFTTNHLTKNDTFSLIGEKDITLNINQEYIEEGVNVISFGKDLKEQVVIESNLDTTKEGEYTIIYTIKNSFKYKDIKRVRYIYVVNGGDNNGQEEKSK